MRPALPRGVNGRPLKAAPPKRPTILASRKCEVKECRSRATDQFVLRLPHQSVAEARWLCPSCAEAVPQLIEAAEAARRAQPRKPAMDAPAPSSAPSSDTATGATTATGKGCQVPNCSAPSAARGRCSHHYNVAHRHGFLNEPPHRDLESEAAFQRRKNAPVQADTLLTADQAAELADKLSAEQVAKEMKKVEALHAEELDELKLSFQHQLEAAREQVRLLEVARDQAAGQAADLTERIDQVKAERDEALGVAEELRGMRAVSEPFRGEEAPQPPVFRITAADLVRRFRLWESIEKLPKAAEITAVSASYGSLELVLPAEPFRTQLEAALLAEAWELEEQALTFNIPSAPAHS